MKAGTKTESQTDRQALACLLLYHVAKITRLSWIHFSRFIIAIAVSGLSDMLSIPCCTRNFANSG